MNTQNNKELFDHIKTELESFHPSYQEGEWENFAKKNSEILSPKFRKNKSLTSKSLLISLSVAASTIIFILASYYINIHSNQTHNLSQETNQPTLKIHQDSPISSGSLVIESGEKNAPKPKKEHATPFNPKTTRKDPTRKLFLENPNLDIITPKQHFSLSPIKSKGLADANPLIHFNPAKKREGKRENLFQRKKKEISFHIPKPEGLRYTASTFLTTPNAPSKGGYGLKGGLALSWKLGSNLIASIGTNIQGNLYSVADITTPTFKTSRPDTLSLKQTTTTHKKNLSWGIEIPVSLEWQIPNTPLIIGSALAASYKLKKPEDFSSSSIKTQLWIGYCQTLSRKYKLTLSPFLSLPINKKDFTCCGIQMQVTSSLFKKNLSSR